MTGHQPFGKDLLMLGLATALAATSCERKADWTPKPSPASSTLSEPERVALMEQHYGAAIAAHDALIRANGGELRRQLTALAAQGLPAKAPESWKPGHAEMREAARKARSAGTDAALGAVMGEVVKACGACHALHGQGPLYKKPQAPEGGVLQNEMQKHQWASERLWEGVTGPWDDAWLRGAQALAKSEVFPRDAGTLSDELVRQEANLRSLALRAQRTRGLTERAALYGKMLATCASCHEQIGLGRKAPSSEPHSRLELERATKPGGGQRGIVQ